MKLTELFEASDFKIPAVRDLPPIDEHELQTAMQQVRNSQEYKDILIPAFDVTTSTKLKNGSITFKLRDGSSDYTIYSNGQIRNQNAMADRATKLKSPIPVPDLYTRYINCLKMLKDIIKRKLVKNESEDSLHISGNVGKDLTEFQFHDGIKNMVIMNSSISSLKGCPSKIVNLQILGNKNLSSLEHIPSDIEGNLILLGSPKIKSFHNINQLIKRIGNKFEFDANIVSNVLSILKIEGLSDGVFCEMVKDSRNFIPSRNSWNNSRGESIVSKILNRHLRTKTRNILACQEDLIDNELKDFAEL